MVARTLKLAVLAALFVLVAAGLSIAAVNGADDSPESPASSIDDVKGPCDEVEHAADPECASPQVGEDADTDGDEPFDDGNDRDGRDDDGDDDGGGGHHRDDDSADDDDSGPSGRSGPGPSSGPGSGEDDDEDDDEERSGPSDDDRDDDQDDRSGPNPGRG